MEEVIRLKSRFVSAKPGEGSAGHTGSDEAAARLVDGILRRKSFYFQQRSGKLDMRAIGRVDVDSVVKNVDIDTLQAHLENITFAHVSEDDLRLYSDQCFLNLFRLSQLLLEYLLSVQDTLATSLEAVALKHSTIRKALDRGRAELHAASEQDRALKREVRQKRATIARYEQLLALPAPSSGRRDAPGGCDGGGNMHSCLTCGKMFTTADYLQQHIVRKHAPQQKNTCNNANSGEEKTSYPSQLRLFVQTSTGQCLDMMVQGGATVAQLRGYINSTAGGMLLHDEQTLRDYNMPSDSQLVLLPTESTEVAAREEKLSGGDTKNDATAAEESAAAMAAKQMSTLVELMRQQMEWNMRSESGKRDKQIGSAEALETRMRGIEASLPRRLEEFMEESVGGLKSSLREALNDMEEMHTKRSNAGVIQDDEEETRRKEEQVQNPTPGNVAQPPRNTISWTLTFPAEGSRPTVTVEVSRTTTCEALCGLIAAELDVADARVVLRDQREGAMIPLTMSSGEMQGLHDEGLLSLEVLHGHVLSDHAVDGLVDFYEQHVPVKARASAAVSRSLAEIDLAAKRHAVAGRKGQGEGEEEGRGNAEDVADHAERQVENIREQLSATLAGRRLPPHETDLSTGVSISQAIPVLGLVGTGGPNASGGEDIGDSDIFGDAQEHHESHLSRADLERAVLERQRTRPAGIQRQMDNVSKTMEEQLNLLLEEAEDELQQLEQDSLGRQSDSGTASQREINKTSRGKDSDKPGDYGGRRRLEDEDLPRSDWGRTLDTAVSIPEGPEERADEHEANASLEHGLESGMTGDDGSDGAMVLMASNGGVDMTALDASAEGGDF
eukprot:g8959.t1